MSDPHQITYANATFTRTEGLRNDRWTCDTCQRFGYGDQFIPGQWATSCARGHAPCPWCGRNLAVCHDGTPRVHAQCPDRPEDLDDRWGRVKVDLRETREVLASGLAT